MKITETFKEGSRKKVMHKDYSLGKRIWEMEQRFNEAIKNGDNWYAEKYDREVTKLYRQAEVQE